MKYIQSFESFLNEKVAGQLYPRFSPDVQKEIEKGLAPLISSFGMTVNEIGYNSTHPGMGSIAVNIRTYFLGMPWSGKLHFCNQKDSQNFQDFLYKRDAFNMLRPSIPAAWMLKSTGVDSETLRTPKLEAMIDAKNLKIDIDALDKLAENDEPA